MLRYLIHIWRWYRNPFRQRPNWAEIAILALTIAILLVYRGQLGVMKDQFVVMTNQLTAMQNQLPEIQKSADAARRSADTAAEANENAADYFREDQRPYVWIDESLKPAPGEISTARNNFAFVDRDSRTSEVYGSIHYKNYGKSPALLTGVDLHLEVGPHAVSKVTWHPLTQETVAILVPGESNYSTSQSAGQLTLAQMAEFMTNDYQFVIFGHVEYQGLDGAEYWSEFCYGRLATGAIASCPSHNLVK